MNVRTLPLLVAVSAFVCSLFLSIAAHAATSIFVTIDGSKQGKFKGEVLARKGFEDKIEAVGFAYEVDSPRDIVSGQPSGRRQHKPVVITKDIGGASPQLFQALTTNEVLKSVLIEFVGTTPDGRMDLSHSIKLTNATLSDIKQYTDRSKDLRVLEDVSFTFQRIEISNARAKTTAMDDWMMGR